MQNKIEVFRKLSDGILIRVHKSRDLRDLDRGHKDTPGDTFWLAGKYFLVHAIFVASKLWIWQHFKENTIKTY